MAEQTMATLLADLATVVSQIMQWISTIASTVVSTPILLVTTGFLMIGGAIGIFGRLLSRG